MKIIDRIQQCTSEGSIPFYSFEYFPPKTEQARDNLLDRIDRMAFNLHPLFIDVTWGAGGSTSQATLAIAGHAQKYSGCEVMMHLTCTNMTRAEIDTALEAAKKCGIVNILALRGDPPAGQERWTAAEGGFEYACDLVAYIREKYEGYFGIAVAGYPEGHLQTPDREEDLCHLKHKVDAGADFVITQLFYDTAQFKQFYTRCREIGISCPIVPGILPIQTFQSFERMTKMCGVHVPDSLIEELSHIRQDDEKVKQLGITFAANMCRELLEFGIPGLHFYTMNLERSVGQILQALNIAAPRAGPWRTVAGREDNEVRPIFWSCKPKSYIDRTVDWDEYPNGRWSDSRSPAYDFGYHSVNTQKIEPNLDVFRKQWGEPQSIEDIREVFLRFLGGKIQKFPWSEEELVAETNLIMGSLGDMNRKYLLTITSQPQVNAAPSTDPEVGWGPENGYCYQKAFVEFFCPPEFLPTLVQVFARHPTLSYIYTNAQGPVQGNMKDGDVNAVTWAIFPNREVKQPTIVDLQSFAAWKDEAFDTWTSIWGWIYEEGSRARTLLQQVKDTFYLVSVVENDFVKGNLPAVFEEAFAQLPPVQVL